MSQDTGKFRSNTKDQYYTSPQVAASCFKKITEICPEVLEYQWIEPSAGKGVFLKLAPVDRIGIDVEGGDGIIRGDFLLWEPGIEKKRIFFGNPPFGRQGSMAKAFIGHAAKFAEVIAFILPRSFVKPSMSRAFPLQFHCLHSEEIGKNAFEVNEKAYDVPCVFQIWKKKNEPRVVEKGVKEVGFKYVRDSYDIAFRRVGGLAGRCYVAAEGISPQSHYFWKLDDKYRPFIKNIIERMNSIIFPSNTVGPRSLSKSEANVEMNRVLRAQHQVDLREFWGC